MMHEYTGKNQHIESGNLPVYMNNAATSWPKAPGVDDAVARTLQEIPCHPGRTHKGTAVMNECRNALARLLAVEEAQQIVLTSNATHSLNLAILGLSLSPGARVITTIMEHNSMLRPLFHLRRRLGLEIVLIGLDKQGALDRRQFEKALDGHASLVAMTHASNVTGQVNDVASFFESARFRGAITLLDASQTMGHMQVHPHELNADLVAFTGHKGLLGPPGTGGLYVAPHLALEQYFVGGTGVRSDLELHPEDMPVRLEAGTPAVPLIAGLAAALCWMESHGPCYLKNEHELCAVLRDRLSRMKEVTIYGASSGTAFMPALSFTVPGWSVEETGYILEESFGIICRTGLHCAPLIHQALGCAPDGTVRISPSGFNSGEDVDRLLEALKRITK